MSKQAKSDSAFLILPAIDLLDGKSVRLRKGARESAETVHSDPITQLAGYAESGASWVHVVNLNAAFNDSVQNAGMQATLEILKTLLSQSRLRVQVGGGMRSRAQIEAMLEMGVSRVVIGTWAVRDPVAVMALARESEDRIVVGLDTHGDKVTVQGWTETSALSVHEFGRRLHDGGVRHALYTQVERDGMLTGIDEKAAGTLAEKTNLNVLASGGVRDISDIERLSRTTGVTGVIVGKALAAGTLELQDALGFERLG